MAYRLCAFADEADSALSGQLDALARNGISLLELRGVDGQNISELTPAAVRELHRRLTDGGISVWSIGSPTGKIRLEEDFTPHLDSFRRMLEAAHILGCSHYRLFSFYNAYEHPQEVISRLGRFCEEAKGSGVTLCLENEKEVFGDTPERAFQLLDALPSLRSIFDPANFVQCGVDVAAAWDLLRERTAYLHIKDALQNGVIVPAGHGIGQIPGIIADYLRRGGEVLTLEPHLAEFVGLSGLEQEGARSEVGSQAFQFENTHAAFDAAVAALKQILADPAVTAR